METKSHIRLVRVVSRSHRKVWSEECPEVTEKSGQKNVHKSHKSLFRGVSRGYRKVWTEKCPEVTETSGQRNVQKSQ